MSLTRISCEQVQEGGLSDFTVLCVPGGFAPHLSTRLGTSGAAAIRKWVHEGGGFVGVCAGAFLGCFLDLIPVSVRHLDHMGASPSPCLVRFTCIGQRLLGASADAAVARYANGPVFALPDSNLELSLTRSKKRRDETTPDVQVHTLAVYASSCRSAAVEMEGSPAIVAGMHGRGLVILVSPHLEDGADERTRSPFRNLFRLAHAANGTHVDYICESVLT
jgi:phosphoribosylformylglycinamidine (FGAM) synthase-like amidotransferase family enzyme